MIEIANKWGKPVFAVAFKLLDRSRAVRLLNENNIPVYYSPERAVRAFAKLIEWGEYLRAHAISQKDEVISVENNNLKLHARARRKTEVK
jgi:acyl-CoA synthetase (NDP forming)